MWTIPVPAWIFWLPDTSIEKACPCLPAVMKPKRVKGKIWSKNKFWCLSCVQFTLSLLLYGDKQSACHAYSTGNKDLLRKFQPLFGLLVAFMTFSLQPIDFADCKRSKIKAIVFYVYSLILILPLFSPLIFFQVYKRSIELKAPMILIKNYIFYH